MNTWRFVEDKKPCVNGVIRARLQAMSAAVAFILVGTKMNEAPRTFLIYFIFFMLFYELFNDMELDLSIIRTTEFNDF